jgi:hypothetical protein
VKSDADIRSLMAEAVVQKESNLDAEIICDTLGWVLGDVSDEDLKEYLL